jgi:multiple sugar transport system substrate-binding protein
MFNNRHRLPRIQILPKKNSKQKNGEAVSNNNESNSSWFNEQITRRDALSKMGKIGIAAGVAVVAAGGGVAAYEYLKPSTSSGGAATLNFMTAAHEDFWYDQESYAPLTVYQQQNPNVFINPIVYSFFDVEAKYAAAFATGNYVWDVAYYWGGLMSFLNNFTPLTNLGWTTSQIGSDLIPWVQNAIYFKGTYYGYPRMNEVFLLNANKTLLDKAGITSMPTTYEQLLEYCKMVHNPSNGVYAFGAGLAAGYLFPVYLNFLHGNGGYFWKNDSTLTPYPDSPQSIAAVTDMLDMYETYMNPGALEWIADVQTSTDFEQGHHVFDLWYPSHNWVVTQPLSSVTSVYCDIWPGHSGVVASGSQVAAESYCIPLKAKYPMQALNFVEYVGQQKNQVECYETGGWTPNAQAPLPSFFSDYNTSSMINWPFAYTVKAHLKQSMYNCSRYERPAYNQIVTVMEAEIGNALDKSKTPSQAMSDAASSLTSIIATEYSTYGGGYYQPWMDVQKSSIQSQFQTLLNSFANVPNYYVPPSTTTT